MANVNERKKIMDTKEKNKTENKCCDENCKCGCQEGKECTCGCNCCCGCRRKGVFKFLAVLLVFLAGMGFNELIHGCCGRCPAKGPKSMHSMHMAMPKPMHMPEYSDGMGNTVIIINTDGSVHKHNFDKMAEHAKNAEFHKRHHIKSAPNMSEQPGNEATEQNQTAE